MRCIYASGFHTFWLLALTSSPSPSIKPETCDWGYLDAWLSIVSRAWEQIFADTSSTLSHILLKTGTTSALRDSVCKDVFSRDISGKIDVIPGEQRNPIVFRNIRNLSAELKSRIGIVDISRNFHQGELVTFCDADGSSRRISPIIINLNVKFDLESLYLFIFETHRALSSDVDDVCVQWTSEWLFSLLYSRFIHTVFHSFWIMKGKSKNGGKPSPAK